MRNKTKDQVDIKTEYCCKYEHMHWITTFA